jgi:excinuclease UvrABC nuclease subunit
MATPLDWPGQSGSTYRYWPLLSLEAASIKPEAGNYMFVKALANGNYLPVYIGQADNLRTRLPNHERMQDAIKAGATLVYAHTNSAAESARLNEEQDLIQRWNPVLNTQHKKAL